MDPALALALVGAVRIAGALPVLRWRLAGALVAMAVDLSDLFLLGLIYPNGWPATLDYQDIARNDNISVVYISTTPESNHYPIARDCLKAGKHVLCEKPFALNEAQGKRMIDAARANGVFVMEALWSRFLPAYVKLRELIAEGAIGRGGHEASLGRGEGERRFDENVAGGVGHGNGRLVERNLAHHAQPTTRRADDRLAAILSRRSQHTARSGERRRGRNARARSGSLRRGGPGRSRCRSPASTRARD